MSTFTVRPSNTDKETFRINLNAVSLLSLKLKSGDTCTLQTTTTTGSAVITGRKKLAIAWEASGIKDTVVQTSKVLQEIYGLKLGDKVAITRYVDGVQDAERIVLQYHGSSLDAGEAKFYETYAKLAIPGVHEQLAFTQRLNFKFGSEESQEFSVKDIIGVGGGKIQDAMIARITKQTTYQVVRAEYVQSMSSTAAKTGIDFCPSHLGGLEQEVRKLRNIVHRLRRTVVGRHWSGNQPVQGVLIYGAKGTGKTAFIQALAQSGWPEVIRWTAKGTKIPPIAKTNEPRLITINLRYISRSSRNESYPPDLEPLLELFEQIKGTPTLVVGEIGHPNDLPGGLRARGKFESEIELPIPSAQQRRQILLAIRRGGAVPPDEMLQVMAERTHGYVGADLEALFQQTLEIAGDRVEPVEEAQAREHESEKVNGLDALVAQGDREVNESADGPPLIVTEDDLHLALKDIRPSALQEIFLETPNVRWSDVGGQHEIKRQLQNAIERPLKLGDVMQGMGLKPKKGVLLYGPPGCSKTLLVRALATEAGLNFLAVKGAELVSMYVGESERATRELFRKARAASPSIIFFDEIDAIASRGRGGSDLNVLTTLLNEMDGFEELRNVLVVAATNKPQNIDPALMRPGRFDNVVYIGPPDTETRTEIFKKRFEQYAYEPAVGVEEDAMEFASLTEGFSGAEIVGICQTAGELGLDAGRRSTAGKDVRAAIGVTPKSITSEMMFEFASWKAARR